MHIVFVTDEYPTESYRAGGMCWAFGKMANAMKAAGHDVSIVVTALESARLHDEAGIPVWRSRSSAALFKRLEAALIWRNRYAIKYLNQSQGIFETVCAVDEQKKIDVVIAAATESAYLLSAGGWPLIYRFSGHPGVVDIANGLADSPAREGRYVINWMREVATFCATARFAPSTIVASVYQNVLGVPVHQIFTPMPSLDYVEEREKTDQPLPSRYICYYGSLQARKGCEVLMRALPRVLDHAPNLEVVIVGRDQPAANGVSMWGHLGDLLKGYAERVHYLGVLEQANAFDVLKQAEWVIFPALFDNLPNTLLEAMLLGRPIIATKESGHDDVIEGGVNAVSVPPGDVDALADTLIDCLDWSEERRVELGLRARESVLAKCRPEHFVSSIEPLMEFAIKAHSKFAPRRLRRWTLKLRLILMILRLHKYGVPDKSIQKLHKLADKYLHALRDSNRADSGVQ